MEQTILTPRLKLTLITKAQRGSKELEWLHENNENTYRIVYAVHELLPTPTSASAIQEPTPTHFIGLITLRSLGPTNLHLPPALFPAAALQPDCLTVELAYQFLPAAWGKGFATESLNAVFAASKRGIAFWTPYEKVYVRAIVNMENEASLKVMRKSDVRELGVYDWSGEKIWLAGRWRMEDRLVIFGGVLVG